jgi:UDP-N-acetyl-D-glucosamine dehydrogenase
MLAQPGMEVGRDFFLCFSPERVDQTRNIPKVVGGITAACTDMGARFYGGMTSEKIIRL